MNIIEQEMESEMEQKREGLYNNLVGHDLEGLYQGLSHIDDNVTYTQGETKIVG